MISRQFTFILMCLALLSSGDLCRAAEDSKPASAEPAMSDVIAPPSDQKIPAFYKKFISANGYPIVGSENVSDYALKEAAYLVNQMLAHRPDVRDAMITSGSRLCIIGHNEFTTDLPEFANLGRPREFPSLTAKDFWDARARGTGGSQTDPYCSCGEENLLSFPGDPYSTENILIHEFAHNIHLRGMIRIDPKFDQRVKVSYEKAMADGLWKGKYASVNHHEYFAEGVQSLCKEVFGETVLKYSKVTTRLNGHMAGYDPTQAPQFVWPERLQKAKAEIRKQAEKRSSGSEK
jgi:hypothetical protein